MLNQEQKQHLFDTVVDHFRAQQGPSCEGKRCLYRSADGQKCFAGIFLTYYMPQMEGFSFKKVALYFPSCIDPLAFRGIEFVRDLQRCHDLPIELHEDFMPSATERLIELAEAYRLETDLTL